MKFKSIILVLLFCGILTGCGGSSNGGCEDLPEYTTESINEIAIALRYAGLSGISDVSEAIFDVSLSVSEQSMLSVFVDFDISVSLFNSANATTCAPQEFNEMITYINIVSDADYDDSHLAGQSLNDLFYTLSPNVPIEEGLYGAPLYVDGFSLTLSDLPTMQKTHNFHIQIELDSGSEFTVELNEMVFQ